MTGGATVHYRCTFDLKPGSQAAPWSDLARIIRSWVGLNAADLHLASSWFFEGGQSEAKGSSRLAVMTAREQGIGTNDAPQFWSVRFDHPDSEIAFRQWRTDIGLSRLDGGVRFSLLTRHWIRSGYIGEEPPVPVPSAPGIIGRLLRARLWRAFSGTQVLSSGTVVLPPGQGDALKALLEDPGRLSPIVLITRQFGSEKILVDADKVARLLAGVATVMVAATAEVNKELEWVLPKGFRSWDGTVRVYQPRLRFDHDPDSRRHRYFTAEQIVAMTPGEVEKILVQGIARRSAFEPVEALTTIEDVLARQREQRLAELRKAVGDSSETVELLGLVDIENDDLRAQIASKDQELRSASELSEGLYERAQQLASEAAKVGDERDYWRQAAGRANEERKAVEARGEAVAAFRDLPRTLSAALALIEAAHRNRIVFTARARKSADEARGYDLNEVWRCLWDMATVLPAVFFDDESNVDTGRAFTSRTGFALAMSEGKLTKNDRSLMRLRKDNHEGQEIDISPHVKIGPTFRIHFFVDRDKRRIVVGHCGEHLTTAGTRRMS